MSLEIMESIRRDTAITKFWKVVSLGDRYLTDHYDTAVIEDAVTYIVAGLPVKKSLEVAEKYGVKMLPFLRNFINN